MSDQRPISTFLGIAAAVVLAATGHAADIEVPGGEPTIQAGINAAVNGDVVIVAQGEYFENINFIGKAITVRSTDPLNPAVVAATIINGGGLDSVVRCESGEGSDTVLSGFVITNGGGVAVGGGMRNTNSSPTVTNCTFSGNTANTGGGMSNQYSSPTVTNCRFNGNLSTAGGGGGMYNNLNSSPTVTNCSFSLNNATTASAGGGMRNQNASSPTVTNCSFSGNLAGLGGGMFNSLLANPAVTNCTFSGNAAYNTGGGIYNQSSGTTVTNCILWGAVFGNEIDGPGTPLVTFSDVQGGFAGTGNIDADPLFVDAANGDYRLSPGSPAIDAADNTAPGLVGITTDLDGNPRFIDDPVAAETGNGVCHVDMGAYEFQLGTAGACCPSDINGDGSINVLDLIDLLLCFGLPATPPCDSADINGDGDVNVLDLIEVLLEFGNACP